MTSSSLSELIASADERALAVSGLACLERCFPLLADDSEPLRPLWSGIAEGGDGWAERISAARTALPDAPEGDQLATLVRRMLDEAPSDWAAGPLAEWAALCAALATDVHREVDPLGATGPLVDGELRRQLGVLDLTAQDPTGASLRRALDLSTEGNRVLRAALSRRARAVGQAVGG